MDRLNEMDAFVHVVDHGGFSEAARRIGISKSAVSKQVAALEDRLGVRLLNRTTRRVNPTEIGNAYYERAKHVLAGAAEADEMVTAMQSAPRGTLRVSVPVNFGESHLGTIVGQFLAEYLDVSVELVLEDRFVELVSEGYDMAIRIGILADSSLKAASSVSRRCGSSPRPTTWRGMARQRRWTIWRSTPCCNTRWPVSAAPSISARPKGQTGSSAPTGG